MTLDRWLSPQMGSISLLPLAPPQTLIQERIRGAAAVTICDPDGNNARLYATGLRNPVGLALEPVTGEVWTSVNERDELGDDLPPDYFTSLKDGGFYGGRIATLGAMSTRALKQEHPELGARAIIPDVLLGAHVAPFAICRFIPASNSRRATEAEPSWPSTDLGTGIALGLPDSLCGIQERKKPSADPVPFMTGLVPNSSKSDVNGRSVGAPQHPLAVHSRPICSDWAPVLS